MSNFQFLHKEWPAIFREAKEAEQLTLTSPKVSAMIARSALEKTVQWCIRTMKSWNGPMTLSCFK